MPADAELDHLDSRLNAFAVSSEEQHDSLQSLLQEYQKLLDSHRQLKRNYEEQKAAKNKYKMLANGREGTPFVLILVDGDGYFFRDRFVRAGDEGGASAAQTLSNSIKEVLLPRLGKDADQYRVMVRVYANLAGLSKIMFRLGNTGSDARSLASFAAGFTGSQDLYEFIDAGDGKDCASAKIQEMYRLFIDSNQCKHIFLAGCHNAGYMPLLTPYRGTTDTVTLIKGPSLIPVFKTLGLPMEELPTVFRCTKIDGSPPSVSTRKLYRAPVPSSSNATVCKFFQKGYCRNGDECRNSHTLPQQTPTPSPFEDNSFSLSLPKSTPENEGLIPVNKKGERIDTYLPRPSVTSWNIYQRRSKILKPCNRFHVYGMCESASACSFDHRPIEQRSIDVMKFLMRDYTCPKGSKCRSTKCYNGHICQKEKCIGAKPCKIRRSLHDIKLEVSHWEFPDDRDQEGRGSFSNNSSEDGVSETLV